MNYQDELQRLLLNDPVRNERAVRRSGAGNSAMAGLAPALSGMRSWDHLHGYGQRPVSGDVDVVWFDAKSGSAADDRALEERLSQQSSAFNWSVKNQARMHQRNGNKPYHSTENALLYWPETATAIAVRMGRSGLIEVIAPYGLDDLFALRLRPTRYLRSISWLFSASASRKNAGCSAIQACS
ncbi:Uncharacterized protein conserved in bacteria [Klebsiella michiganensis]|uniref:Uncharacterized protein conserved in bacteria n=1 Tax=Klebsiella michiganensis TaxID=1134687 RepID=A0A7H4MZA7_9ENTR|nr:Uncharacterized protein conserved in bacteria [Klebsiella michiganensis]